MDISDIRETIMHILETASRKEEELQDLQGYLEVCVAEGVYQVRTAMLLAFLQNLLTIIQAKEAILDYLYELEELFQVEEW